MASIAVGGASLADTGRGIRIESWVATEDTPGSLQVVRDGATCVDCLFDADSVFFANGEPDRASAREASQVIVVAANCADESAVAEHGSVPSFGARLAGDASSSGLLESVSGLAGCTLVDLTRASSARRKASSAFTIHSKVSRGASTNASVLQQEPTVAHTDSANGP